MGSSFWEDREGTSAFDSESTGGSSDCALSFEEEEDEELTEEEWEEEDSYKEQDGEEGYIVISSDEELMDLEAPIASPQTPLTPGSRLELTDPQEWAEDLEGESPGYTALLDPVLELHKAGQPQGPLQSPCMQGKEEVEGSSDNVLPSC